jgi:lactoylglutathione lyase
MKSRIRLGYVIIYVEDVLTTIAFYHKAFGLEQRFLHESHQYAEMETGQTLRCPPKTGQWNKK